MPFPTVDGKTFTELFAELGKRLPLDRASRVLLSRLFEQVDIVATQLYYDVQKLKKLAKEHSWNIEDDDPSQKPIVEQ
jgi:hypothetical protein